MRLRLIVILALGIGQLDRLYPKELHKLTREALEVGHLLPPEASQRAMKLSTVSCIACGAVPV